MLLDVLNLFTWHPGSLSHPHCRCKIKRENVALSPFLFCFPGCTGRLKSPEATGSLSHLLTLSHSLSLLPRGMRGCQTPSALQAPRCSWGFGWGVKAERALCFPPPESTFDIGGSVAGARSRYKSAKDVYSNTVQPPSDFPQLRT